MQVTAIEDTSRYENLLDVAIPMEHSFPDIPDELASLAEPSETALLEILRPRVSRLMMEEIAANDYGEDIPGNLAALLQQVCSAAPLGLMEWHPREVLELERWNDPEEGGQDRQIGHLKRLLACTILLRNAGHLLSSAYPAAEDEFFVETSAASVVRLLRSTLALGSLCELQALAFHLWLYKAQSNPRLRAFVAVTAALLGIAACARHDDSQTTQVHLTAWADGVEKSSRLQLGLAAESEPWLVGLNNFENSSTHRKVWFAAMRDVEQRCGNATALRRWMESHPSLGH